jgi:hypothetical protein
MGGGQERDTQRQRDRYRQDQLHHKARAQGQPSQGGKTILIHRQHIYILALALLGCGSCRSRIGQPRMKKLPGRKKYFYASSAATVTQ